MFLSVCDSGQVLSVLRIVKIVIQVIRIAVPFILILTIMFDFIQAMVGEKEDELSIAGKKLIRRFVAAVIIFMIPTLVNVVNNLVDENNKSYISCLQSATPEKITQAYYNEANSYVKRAYNTLELSDYNIAVSKVKKLKDKDSRDKLNAELKQIYEYVKIMQSIKSLKKNYDKDLYDKVAKQIEAITDKKVKEKLKKALESVLGGTPLNVTAGGRVQTYDGLTYYEIIPPNATTNLPLIVFLHGDGELGSINSVASKPICKYVLSKEPYKAGNFIFIAPLRPTSEYATSTNINGTMKVIKYIVDKYKINKNKVIITGMSGGSILTWGVVNANPDYFSATVPMSCGPSGADAKNFKTTPVWSISGTVPPENSYGKSMSSFCDKINAAGGKAKHTTYSGESHGTIQNRYKNLDLFKWMLEQEKKR